MSTETMRPDVKIILRHVDPPEAAREYAMTKLGETIYAVPGLRYASIEITYEATVAEEQRYVVQVTLAANGNTIRVKERGPGRSSCHQRDLRCPGTTLQGLERPGISREATGRDCPEGGGANRGHQAAS